MVLKFVCWTDERKTYFVHFFLFNSLLWTILFCLFRIANCRFFCHCCHCVQCIYWINNLINDLRTKKKKNRDNGHLRANGDHGQQQITKNETTDIFFLSFSSSSSSTLFSFFFATNHIFSFNFFFFARPNECVCFFFFFFFFLPSSLISMGMQIRSCCCCGLVSQNKLPIGPLVDRRRWISLIPVLEHTTLTLLLALFFHSSLRSVCRTFRGHQQFFLWQYQLTFLLVFSSLFGSFFFIGRFAVTSFVFARLLLLLLRHFY